MYDCVLKGYEYISGFSFDNLVETSDVTETYLRLGLILFIVASTLNLLFGWVRFISRKKKELLRMNAPEKPIKNRKRRHTIFQHGWKVVMAQLIRFCPVIR